MMKVPVASPSGELMRRVARGIAVMLAITAWATSRARAQSVAEVVEGMYAAAERMAAPLSDYTLTQHVMGVETFSYFEKESVDGHPVFRLKMSDGAGFSLSLAGEDVGLGDVFIYGPGLVEHGRYVGTEQMGTFSVHVIAVDDAAAMEIVAPSGGGPSRFTTKSLRLSVDATMMVPRRIELVGDAVTDAGLQELAIKVDMESFLPIESLWVPFKTSLQVAGVTVEVTVAEVLINAGRPSA
jgi:hypothetical protein